MGLKRGKRASSEGVEPAVSEDRCKRAKTAGDAGKFGLNAQISSTLDKAPKTDSNGDPYWEISRQRRVTISTFKGRVLVNVREYYEKDGQELPGKKVILSIEPPSLQGNHANPPRSLPGHINDTRTVQQPRHITS